MAGRVWQALSQAAAPLLVLFAASLVFFLANASGQLAADDVAWLQGQAPTVFDQYRIIPRLFLVALHMVFGPSAAAALTVIFLFHALNGLLVCLLSCRLLRLRKGALLAAAVVLINPLTLNTLTWISCFSYVLGTTFALLSLLAFWRALDQKDSGRWVCLAGALSCLGAALLCTHEVFFLPVLYPVLGWLREKKWVGTAALLLGMGLTLVVNRAVYGFERYGVDAAQVFTPGFGLAYLSSALSSGVALGLAYPVSFFVKPVAFLRFCFTEPARWLMTLVVLAAGFFFLKRNRIGRLSLALVISLVALITPYLIRLYLTPDSVNFHISYALSGRVFYLPFTVLAMMLGWTGAWLVEGLKSRPGTWLLVLLSVGAYGRALWLYDRTDFLGLSVVHGPMGAMPPRWNPYAHQDPTWFGGLVLAVVLLFGIRLALDRRRAAGFSSD